MPGSGKSVFIQKVKIRLNDNLLVVDGDQFRQYHPNFEKLEKLVGADTPFYTGEWYGKVLELY